MKAVEMDVSFNEKDSVVWSWRMDLDSNGDVFVWKRSRPFTESSSSICHPLPGKKEASSHQY